MDNETVGKRWRIGEFTLASGDTMNGYLQCS